LHLGHAYSALLNAHWAQQSGGRLLLRIEDIDTTRCRPEFEQAIYDDLAWLRLTWEKPVRRQSDHFGDYERAFETLRKRDLVYPCFCSRKEILVAVPPGAGRDPDGALLYPGTCKSLSLDDRQLRLESGARHSWRLDMSMALRELGESLMFSSLSCEGDAVMQRCFPERWGDPIIVRKETPTSYHLSVVVDDALQRVSHVIRGKDIEAATDLHVMLQKLLCLPTPFYLHHDLVLGEQGEKLSKSLGSEALSDLRNRGVSSETIREALGF